MRVFWCVVKAFLGIRSGHVFDQQDRCVACGAEYGKSFSISLVTRMRAYVIPVRLTMPHNAPIYRWLWWNWMTAWKA